MRKNLNLTGCDKNRCDRDWTTENSRQRKMCVGARTAPKLFECDEENGK